MKNIAILFLVIIFTEGLYAQSYDINFDGLGDTTIVDNVYVKNINQGTALMLKGNDILKLNFVSSINDFIPDINSINVYPNPMSEQAEIHFTLTKSNSVFLAIYDESGRLVLRSNSFLHPGIHRYLVSGLDQGLYIVRIIEPNAHFNAKLICQNNSNYEAKIKYVSSDEFIINPTHIKQLKSTSSIINMDYISGDTLKFTAVTGDYSAVVTDIPLENRTITFDFKACTDADGNKYHIERIGSQLWMSENLRTTEYGNNDAIGTTIPLTLNIMSELTPKYQWVYEGDENYIPKNGRLYTWYAATDSRNICPVGWHLPTDTEWTILTDYLTNNGFGYGGSGNDIAKSLAAKSDWTNSPLPGVPGNEPLDNNTSSFTAFPSGCHIVVGISADIGIFSYMWSSSEGSSSQDAKCMLLSHNTDSVRIVYNMKSNGFSVRCIKD
jgi:uncharacterized protein (TIGR02145 family)